LELIELVNSKRESDAEDEDNMRRRAVKKAISGRRQEGAIARHKGKEARGRRRTRRRAGRKAMSGRRREGARH